jgi:hypothetical protein
MLDANLVWDTSQLYSTGSVEINAINYPQWATAANLSGVNALATTRLFREGPVNLMRYAMNLGLAAAPGNAPTSAVTIIDNTEYLTLQYRERKGMTNYQLVPQYSTDLVNWINVDAGNITQLTDVDAYTAQYQAVAALPAHGAVFLRVVAEPVP